MSWDTAQNRAENHQGNSLFVRLADDGEKIVVVFCGEPLVRELVWNQKTGVYDDFTAEHEKAGTKPSPRYVLNVFVPAENAMKVMEFSNVTFKAVLKAKEKYNIEKWSFEVERSGKKGDTKTSYTVLPEKELDAATLKTIAATALHDLKKVGNDSGDDSTDMSSHDKKTNGASNGKTEEKPAIITGDQAGALIGRLKPMDKKRVEEFLAKFKIAKVKELAAGEFKTAEALLDEWEGKKAPAAPAEVDPFA